MEIINVLIWVWVGSCIGDILAVLVLIALNPYAAKGVAGHEPRWYPTTELENL